MIEFERFLQKVGALLREKFTIVDDKNPSIKRVDEYNATFCIRELSSAIASLQTSRMSELQRDLVYLFFYKVMDKVESLAHFQALLKESNGVNNKWVATLSLDHHILNPIAFYEGALLADANNQAEPTKTVLEVVNELMGAKDTAADNAVKVQIKELNRLSKRKDSADAVVVPTRLARQPTTIKRARTVPLAALDIAPVPGAGILAEKPPMTPPETPDIINLPTKKRWMALYYLQNPAEIPPAHSSKAPS